MVSGVGIDDSDDVMSFVATLRIAVRHAKS